LRGFEGFLGQNGGKILVKIFLDNRGQGRHSADVITQHNSIIHHHPPPSSPRRPSSHNSYSGVFLKYSHTMIDPTPHIETLHIPLAPRRWIVFNGRSIVTVTYDYRYAHRLLAALQSVNDPSSHFVYVGKP